MAGGLAGLGWIGAGLDFPLFSLPEPVVFKGLATCDQEVSDILLALFYQLIPASIRRGAGMWLFAGSHCLNQDGRDVGMARIIRQAGRLRIVGFQGSAFTRYRWPEFATGMPAAAVLKLQLPIGNYGRRVISELNH